MFMNQTDISPTAPDNLPIVYAHELHEAESHGPDEVLDLIVGRISSLCSDRLDAAALERLNGMQVTLWAYHILREEVMDGGFIQLIHNGYGPLFFCNPFAKAMRLIGLKEFSKLVYKAQKLYERYGNEIEQPMTDEEFMALYERLEAFDEVDDAFITEEEDITAFIADYTLNELSTFVHCVDASPL